MSFRTARSSAPVPALLVLVAIVVVPASPAYAVSCSQNGTILTVTNDALSLTIANAGGNLTANGGSCGAISSINTVNIDMGGTGDLIFDVEGGLGPGATDEGNGTSELEFNVTNVDLSLNAFVGVQGTAGADGFAAGEAIISLQLVRQINLNALAEAGGAKDADVFLRGSPPPRIHLEGEAGDDQLSGTGIVPGISRQASVPLLLTDGAGNDTLVGGAGGDILQIGLATGVDSVLGGGGNDTVFLDPGLVTSTTVSLDGVANDGGGSCPSTCQDNVGADIEAVSGSSANDHIIGNAGVQTIFGNTGADQLYGLGGNDFLNGRQGNDLISGGRGNDALPDDTGSDTMLGGPGIDTVDFTQAPTGITLTLDDVPNDGPDGFDNVASDVERVVGSPHDDRLVGNSGINRFVGAAGLDILDGRGGNDMLQGGDQNDRLLGGLGNDSLVGGAQADVMRGGGGRDTVTYANSPAAVVVSLDGAANDGSAGEGDNVGSDVENVVGSPYPDRLRGSPAANLFRGGGAGDVLRGFGGNDSLYGQAGNDALYGGTGTDRCSQGPGSGPKVSCER